MREIRFGVFLSPSVGNLGLIDAQATAAEEAGFDYVSVQDHPYVPELVDPLALVAHLAARTARLRFMTNVANLPLRPAPMLAKTAATLDLLSGGRFDLGLGGGRSWDQIEGLGGPRWTPGETVDAVSEAIDALRTMWRPGRVARLDGGHYPLHDVASGPAPAHPVRVLLGAGGPRMLDLLGRKADGWIVPMRTDHDARAAGQARIDEAARRAGRDPGDVHRVVQVVGVLDPGAAPLPASHDVATGRSVVASADDWVRLLTDVVTEQRFDAVNLITGDADPAHLRRFGEQVIPRVRAELAS